MTKRRILLASTLVGFMALGLPWGLAEANHVRIDIKVEPGHASPGVGQPGPPASLSYTPAPVPETFRAREIQAHEIRAQTIYANRIEADEIRGTLHQTKGVKVGDVHGDIKAPQVSAAVIYAEEISANSVIADNIYVRDLRRK